MTTPPTYPPGTVRALLTTDHVSPATRTALTNRLQASSRSFTPSFFSESEFLLLRAICHRLTGADDLSATIDVARTIDTRLAAGESDGWRFADFPDDAQTWRLALAEINADARHRFAQSFTHLTGEEQDAVLAAIRAAEPSNPNRGGIEPRRFFAKMLAEVSQAFYGHPLAQEEIGYVGMADLPNWRNIGLNQRDEREPDPFRSDDDAS